MRNGFLTAVAALLAGAGVALANPPGPIVQISFDDADQTATSDGVVVKKVGTVASSPMPAAGAPCAPMQAVAAGAPCGPCGRVWASAEYLVWWIRDMNLPPLVTTGPATVNTVLSPEPQAG